MSITFPETFRANVIYQLVLAALTLIGAAGAGYVMPHQRIVGVALWALTGLYLLLLVLAFSLQIRVDADGLTQRWLTTRTFVAWKQVERAEQTPRMWSLLGADGKELVLLQFLPRAAQQVIVEEAKSRARLRQAAEPLKPPMIELWERKSK